MNATIAECIAALAIAAGLSGVAFVLGSAHGRQSGVDAGKADQRIADNNERDTLIAEAVARLKVDATADLKTSKDQNATIEAQRSAAQTMADTWFARAQLLDKRLSAPSAVGACTLIVPPAGTAPDGAGDTAGPDGTGLSNADARRYLSACTAALIPARTQLDALITADAIWRQRDARGCEP